LLLVVLAFSLIACSGCSPKPINRETLDYFYGLVNQQYWQLQANGLALNDEYGTEQLILAAQGMSDKEQYLTFGDIYVTSSDPKSGPIDAMIKVRVFNGSAEKDVRIRVDDMNRTTLEKMLAETFESRTQREQRLKGEAYAASIKEADTLLAANKVADAIAAFKAAQEIDDTDVVKTRLDCIYLEQGRYYYGLKKYDVALAQLRLVSFDPSSLSQANTLILEVTADMEKAAAEKAAADKKAAADRAAAAAKAAAEKAAVEKPAVQRRTWFDALDKYFWELADLDTKRRNTSSDSPLFTPLMSSLSLLNDKIGAYCSGNVGMDPIELDDMRQHLASFAVNSYRSCSAYYNRDYYSSVGSVAYMKRAEADKTEYVRLRAVAMSRLGY
jgi:hypothetical protein